MWIKSVKVSLEDEERVSRYSSLELAYKQLDKIQKEKCNGNYRPYGVTLSVEFSDGFVGRHPMQCNTNAMVRTTDLIDQMMDVAKSRSMTSLEEHLKHSMGLVGIGDRIPVWDDGALRSSYTNGKFHMYLMEYKHSQIVRKMGTLEY